MTKRWLLHFNSEKTKDEGIQEVIEFLQKFGASGYSLEVWSEEDQAKLRAGIDRLKANSVSSVQLHQEEDKKA